MSVLALAPGGDYAADVAARWGEDALRSSQATRLAGARVTLEDLKADLGAAGPGSVVCYLGHGVEPAWITCATLDGRLTQDRTILDVDDALHLAGASVLSVACLAAAELGPAARASGAVEFVGFRRRIAWRPDVEGAEVAVGRCINDLVATFLRQRPCSEAALIAVVEEHWNYWRDLKNRGSETAAVIVGYIDLIRLGLVVL